MPFSFRHFIRANDFSCSLSEEEAAPAMGSDPANPSDPNKTTTNKHHFDFLKRQFGINDDDFVDAIEAVPVQIFKVPDYSDKWGFLVIGDCEAGATQRDDGNWQLTFMLSQKHSMNPNAFILPYRKGENPIIYKGKVEDKTEIVSEEELQDMIGGPLAPLTGLPSAPPPMGAM